MIHQVFIQVADDGDFPNAALCAAYLGFKIRGRAISGLSEVRWEQFIVGVHRRCHPPKQVKNSRVTSSRPLDRFEAW